MSVGDSQGESYVNELFVDGNLYLDFSLWGNVGGIDASQGGEYSFHANTIALLGSSEQPSEVINYETIFIAEPASLLDLNGGIIAFSDSVISSSIFTATDGIYIGDFSKYSPVPLPASMYMFLTGLAFVFRRSHGIVVC